MGGLKYKVGDRVKIQSLERYNKYKNRYGDINYGCETEILFTSEMSSFCGQVVTITRVRYIGGVRFYHLAEDKEVHLWVAGMFEALVERNGKTYPYKIGDRVVLKGNNQCATITDLKCNSLGDLLYYIRIDNDRFSINYPTELLLPYKEPKFKVGDRVTVRGMSGIWEITNVEDDILYTIKRENHTFTLTTYGSFLTLYEGISDKKEEMKSKDELLDEYEELTDRAFKGGYEKCKSDILLNGYELPEGYIFKDHIGNEIHALKIVLEKANTLKTQSDNMEIETHRGYYTTEEETTNESKETSWKPSKEEMDVLYGLAYITNKYDEHKEEVITRLYQDLKREFFNGSSYENMFPNTENDVRRRSTIQVLEYARSLDNYNQYGKADIDKNIAWLEKQGKSALEARTDNELVEEEVGLVDNFSSRWVNEFNLPDGYQFKDENGNVINAQKIVLEKLVVPKFKKGDKIKDKNNRVWYVEQVGKKHFDISRIPNGGSGYFVPIEDQDYYELVPDMELPKTFEDCVSVLMSEGGNRMSLEQMNTFRKLIDARNAYWTIYGKENGLEKPWEPDYKNEYQKKYCIYNNKGDITKSVLYSANAILSFPTEEMRNTFYENFKSEIESCKEFL